MTVFGCFVCCKECGFREKGKPRIWHQKDNGIVCPNCKKQWTTEKDYQIRKKLDKLFAQFKPCITFENMIFLKTPELEKIRKQFLEDEK